ASLAEPKVCKLMKQCERPSYLSVLIVDDDEWSDPVGQREAAECCRTDCCVMTPKVSEQQDEDARRLAAGSQIGKGVIDTGLRTIGRSVEGDRFLYTIRQSLYADRNIDRADESYWRSLVFIFEHGANDTLPRFDIAQQRVY